MKINLTIEATANYVKVEYLNGDGTVTGTNYISFTSIRDEIDGWWLDRFYEAAYNKKIMFADIVNYNGSAIGSTTQATITAALLTCRNV